MTDITLPDDAPGKDTSDIALRQRASALQEVDNLRWLSADGMIAKAAKDVGTGLTELPTQAVGGVRDAAQAFLELGDELERLVPLGGVQFFDDKGNFDMQYVPPAELAAQYAKVGSPELPNVRQPASTTGSVARGVSQFLAGFGLAGKVIGGFGSATKAGVALKTTGASIAADFFAFDGQQERLSNLISDVPGLKNPVTDFLAAKEDDPEFLGRAKNVLEGLGLDGAVALTLGKGLKKSLAAYKKAAAGRGDAEAASNLLKNMGQEKVLRDAGELRAIGNASPDAPLMFMRDAAKEIDTGVPHDIEASALVAERGLSPLGKSDVYVNFAKIETPEDIQRIIQDTSSAFAENIDQAKRGVRTNAQTRLSADQQNAWKVLAGRRTGDPLNAEQALAARQLWASSGEKLAEVANLAAGNPSPENLYQFRKMLAVHHGIQKEVIAARTETARALQSWAIPAGGGKERMQSMAQTLERFGGIEASEELARKIALASTMPNGAEIVSNLVEKSTYAKGLSSVQEYWINALLSGPKTHAANIISNTGVAAAAVLERSAASRLSRFLGTEGGVEIGEAAAQVAGLRGGILDAFQYAGKALRTGQTGFGLDKIETPRVKSISSTAWNVRSDSWLGKAIDGMGAVINIPGRMLQAEDEFFKTIGYRMELHAQAQRMAVRELGPNAAPSEIAGRVSEIIKNPPEAIRMDATEMAAYQTFTSAPGNFVRSLGKVKGTYPELNFIIPFVNTPANILRYTFERTPLAPLSSRYRAAMAKGGADADLALTKMGMGTVALLYAIDLGMNGVISGSGPSKPSESQTWRRQGNQPYSVKFGDKQVAFNRLDPIGYHLGIGADIAEYLVNAGGDSSLPELEEGIAASVFAVAENVTSKSYMQGLALLMEALNEPDRFASSYVERFASSFIPSGVAEVARITDPVSRQAHDIVSAMKRRIPGLSADLPPRRDVWGREISYQSGFGAAYDTISPLYGATAKPEPIDTAMQTGGWHVGMPSKTMQIDGEHVSMRNRPDIYSDYLKLQGSTVPSEYGKYGKKVAEKYGNATLLDTLNGIVTGQHPLSVEFKSAETPDDQERVIDRVINDYRRAARNVILDKYPDLKVSSARKKAARLKRQEVVN